MCPRKALPLPLLIWLVAFPLAAMQGRARAQCNSSPVRIHLDSVVAGITKTGIDPRLGADTRGRLLALFDYSSYQLIRSEEAVTPCGQPVAFNLPAGRILHVWPLAIHGNMIALDLVMFAGARAIMRTQLKVMKGGMLVLVGSQNPQGAYLTSLRIESLNSSSDNSGQTPVATPLPAGTR
jgi:hypothetical protein